MSISDQAFIRAYHEEANTAVVAPAAAIDVGLDSVIPPPHVRFPSHDTKASRETKEMAEPVAAPAEAAHLQVENDGPISLEMDAVETASEPSTASAKRYAYIDRGPKTSLSSLVGQSVAAKPAAATMARPALEVEAVVWPAICDTLLAQYGDRFDRMALELSREAGNGFNTIAITGIHRGEGRTTLALCLARRLAAGRAKVAVVDADFLNGSLAAQLHIDVDRGWEAVLDDSEALWDVMIESASDGLAILPLGRSLGHYELPAAFRVASALGQLAEHYDIVLVDAGPLNAETPASQWLLEPENNVDSVILANDVRQTRPHQLAAGCVQLAEVHCRQLGIAEIFVVEETARATQANSKHHHG